MPKENIARGAALQKKMFGRDHVPRARSPAWDDWAQGTLFGELWNGPNLDLRTRSLVTVALIAAQARPEQLAAHVRGAISNGAKPKEIVEAIQHTGFYAGWPNGAASLAVADKVLTEMGL
ncbi:MAG: carboxymuconolactone decarboxylase family protein [Betaproteobacteria bacterium]|nr:carboxymuconolactone decarboxylase family protein [Betaproteobacteria bacterium]